jgi:hypothetical protein
MTGQHLPGLPGRSHKALDTARGTMERGDGIGAEMILEFCCAGV